MNELTLGFSSAVGRVFIDVNCVDDSDDDCIDRQLFGFGCQSRTAALGDQDVVVFARAKRVYRNEGSTRCDQGLPFCAFQTIGLDHQ